MRGGFIRQVGAGLWTFLPLGWRVHRKVEQIIREEMDAIGSQEMLAPVLTPAELWKKTGRYGIPEIFKLQDRNGRDFVLPLTHEETFTFHAREIQSYKQLPQLWYHFQTKDRDEPRPRGGLLRVREFIMKDSYSFDRDEAGLDESFEKNRGAYEPHLRALRPRRRTTSQAESGMMGGSESLDFLAPSGSGENTLVTCENGDYAADLEIARAVPRAPDVPGAARRARGGRDAGHDDDRGARRAARRSTRRRPRRRCRTRRPTARVVLALVRGDDRLEEAKLLAALGADARPSTEDEIRAAFGADPGSLGPVGFDGRGDRRRAAARRAVRRRREPRPAGIYAASSTGATSQARFADIRVAEGGRPLPELRRRAAVPDRDRGRPHLQARHEVLGGARRDVPRRGRAARSRSSWARTASGPGRVMAAAVEQHHDEHGIVWPREIAPYDVHVVVLPGAEEIGAAGGGGALGGRARRAARRPRRARRREVRRRRPDRLPDPGHGGQEEPRGRQGRRAGTARPARSGG